MKHVEIPAGDRKKISSLNESQSCEDKTTSRGLWVINHQVAMKDNPWCECFISASGEGKTKRAQSPTTKIVTFLRAATA